MNIIAIIVKDGRVENVLTDLDSTHIVVDIVDLDSTDPEEQEETAKYCAELEQTLHEI